MSRIRGDDDLLSLMGEMASAAGYDEPAAALSDDAKAKNTETRPIAARVRLTSEVNGYPSNKLAGSSMIWNPYTQVSSPSRPAKCMFPPTNPQVEVFRRRSYERFKGEFRACLERISVNATAKVGPSNLWSEISPVSMMERWHFDAKLQEFLQNAGEGSFIANTGGLCASTSQIKLAIDQGMMDPILISTNTKRKRKRGEKYSESLHSPTSLLSEEVKFEWTRTWKRIAGDKYKDTDLKEILKSKRFQKKLSRLCRSVMEAATEVEASFYNQVSKRAALEAQLAGRPPKKSSIPKLVVEEEDVYVKFSGLSFRLNMEHYRKLQVLFDRMHSNSTDRASHESAFVSSLFCLLCRYDMLQGAGLQSSMHGSVFDVLLQHYDCRLECFASPLNSRYERFCSAFVDTDASFGSVGSFFDYDFSVGGCFQANPPFATNFITCMYGTMDQALQSCKEPLQFVVFVPAWKDTPGWNLLDESPFLTKHVSLSQSSHYYCEGTQHRRKDRYRVASFDTSVFFLQNKAAAAKWEISDSQIKELKSAFSMDPNEVIVKEVVTVPVVNERSAMMASGVSKRPASSVTSSQKEEPRAPSESKKRKKKKKKQKQKALSETEEGAQQLGILNSLGIPSDDKSEQASHKKKRRRK